MKNNKRILIAIIGIIFLSFILKLWWINNIPLNPIYDFETLYKVAVNLFSGEGFTLNGYQWGFQSYGYPLILSLFFRIVNSSTIFTAKVFNVIISTLTLPIFFLIFNKIFSSKKVTWFCFIIAAFLPNHIVYNNVLGTEVLTVFLFSLIICMSLFLNEKNRKTNLFIQGIFCGILSLVKPFFIAYPIVLLFIYFIKREKLKTLFSGAMFLLVGFSAILIPSTIKNYKAFKEFIPISYNGGFTLYVNNNSQNITGTWMNAYKVEATDEFKTKLQNVGYIYDVDAQTEKAQNLINPKASKIFQQGAVNWIVNNPGEFISLGVLRIISVFFDGASDIKLWGFEPNIWNNLTANQIRLFKVGLGLSNILIYTLSISVIIMVVLNIKNMFLKQTEFPLLLILWSIAFFYAIYFVVEGQSRYNFPTLFLMIGVMGILIDTILTKVNKK